MMINREEMIKVVMNTYNKHNKKEMHNILSIFNKTVLTDAFELLLKEYEANKNNMSKSTKLEKQDALFEVLWILGNEKIITEKEDIDYVHRIYY